MFGYLTIARGNLFRAFSEGDDKPKPDMPLWITTNVATAKYPVKVHVETIVSHYKVRKDPKNDYIRRQQILRHSSPNRMDVGSHSLIYLFKGLVKVYGGTRHAAKM